MTLNVVWSDAQGAKYLLCDSARTHPQEPRFSHSILGQLQRNRRNYAVEEGAQKIVRLTDTAGAALCGSEYDALEFLRLCMHAYSTGDQMEFNRYVEDPPDVPTEISLAEAGSPISIFQPHHRAILELRPFELSIRGSLDDATSDLLAQAIGRNLIERGDERTAEEKLVHALGYAMTVAAQFNLTEHGVGGSFFGATITESGSSWQPDILYVLYTPATVGNAFGENRVDELDANVNRVIAQVRDDVGVSASLTVGRIVIASSRSMTPDIHQWLAIWPPERLIDGLFQADYFVFAPTAQGNTVIVKNTGTSVRFSRDRFEVREDVLELLTQVPQTPFRAVYLMPEAP